MNDISNLDSFLNFVDECDLSGMEGAYFVVDGQAVPFA